jgi:hypothetical protein
MRLLGHIQRQLRRHPARMHTISHHPLSRILRTRKLTKLQHRKLARLIRTHPRPQPMRPRRAQIHNRLQPPLALDQQRQKRPRSPIHPAVIDLPRRPVLVRVGIRHWARGLEIACVVNEDIQAAERLFRLGGSALDGFQILHVQLDSEDVGRGLPGGLGGAGDLGGEAGQVGACGDGDLGGAGFGVGQGGGAADALGGARDEDRFSGEVGVLGRVDGGVGVVMDWVDECHALEMLDIRVLVGFAGSGRKLAPLWPYGGICVRHCRCFCQVDIN